ncbi:MAG: hypothetical protein KDA93_09195 [Planctomycetaceae bacterium]|nr:hypothetical protein [Planctomycetaceae bacterium]
MSRTLMSPDWCRWLLQMLLVVPLLGPAVISADDSPLQSTEAPVLLPVPEPTEGAEDVIRAALESSVDADDITLTAAAADGSDETNVQPQVVQVEKGSSSRRLRQSAIDALPLRNLHPQYRQAANSVLDDMTVFRQLPAFQCELDPRVHDYFTQHPDVAVSIWRAMAISNLQMTQCNNMQYDIDTHDGTTGKVTVLHHSREHCLVLCDGMFKSPYLKNAIHARSLMHLRTNIGNSRDGRTFVTHQANLFVSFPSQGVGTIAKLVSPVSNQIIDRNFQEICLFIHVMWHAMLKQPGWVEQIAGRMDGVHESRKDELVKLTADVYVSGRVNAFQQSGQPISFDDSRPSGQGAAQTASAPQSNRVR